MDVTPSFGFTMISEVPSNPQLTLAQKADWTFLYYLSYFFLEDLYP